MRLLCIQRLVIIWALVSAITPMAQAQEAIREQVQQHQPQLTKPPQLLKFIEAVYPEAAREEGRQGTVELQLDLDAQGKVSAVLVLAAPAPDLAAAAAAAAKQFIFSPAQIDGRPGPVRLTYAYRFRLETAFEPRVPNWAEEAEEVEPGRETLVGTVREQGTRLRLAGVAVAIVDLGLETTTDEKGAFAFAAVPPGTYQVQAISLEHERETVEAEVSSSEQTRIQFYLPRLNTDGYETVVRGQRRKTEVTRITLKQHELTTVPGTFGDPLRVIENLPGAARTPYVGGALLIRGSAPEDSGVFFEKIRIPIIYHFLGGPSVINPQFLDRIDYYPGNVDVRYGRLTTGVVDVASANTFTKQIGGSVDINLLNSSIFLKAPVTEKVSVAAAFRRSYIDAILPSIFDAAGQHATTVVPVYYDYQLRVDAKLRGDNQLFLMGFGSDDTLDIASNEPDNRYEVSLNTRIAFHRILGQWRWQINDRLVSRLTPSLGIDWVNFGANATGADVKTIVTNLREDIEYRLNKAMTLRVGLDSDTQTTFFDATVPILADYRNPGAGINVPISENPVAVTLNQTDLGIATFVDGIWQLTPRLQMIPGTRFEMFRYFGQTKFSVNPRLTSRFQLNQDTLFKGGAGMYSQAPQPPYTTEQYGNPHLLLIQAAHFSVGLEQKFLSALGLDAQLYYLHRYNQIVQTKQVILDENGNRRPLRFTNQGNGYSYGLELILKHDVTRHFYGWISYTLSRSKQQEQPAGPYLPFVFDQTHILTMVGSVRLGKGWELGTRFRLVSGRPDTQIIEGILDSDRNRFFPYFEEKRTIRGPLFHQLDFRVEKTWMFDLWRLAVYLDVQNIYNAENPEATLWDYRYKESGPLRGLPLLPTLGVKGSF